MSIMLRPSLLLPLVLICLTNLVASSANCSPIYMLKNKDGSITFTTRQPASGVKAEVFTGKGNLYSRYRASSGWRGFRLYKDKYNQDILSAANKYGVEPGLVKAVIHAESAFNPHARSPKGAMGLMQLMPQTARELGVRNAYHPEQNILGGTKHLSRLLQKYNGDLRLSIAAYNAGEEAVKQYGGIPPFSETRTYVNRVLRLYKEYRAIIG